MAKSRLQRRPEVLGYCQPGLELLPLVPEKGAGEVIQGTLFELKEPSTEVGPYGLEGMNVRSDGTPIRPRARRGPHGTHTTQLEGSILPTQTIRRRARCPLPEIPEWLTK